MNAPVESKLLPCPFCGASAMQGLTKAVPCQLHGEKLQRFEIWCPHGCARINRVNRKLAITAWNTRTNQVAELVEGLEKAHAHLSTFPADDYPDSVALVIEAALASHKGEQP